MQAPQKNKTPYKKYVSSISNLIPTAPKTPTIKHKINIHTVAANYIDAILQKSH